MKYVNPDTFIKTEVPSTNQYRLYKVICRAYKDSMKFIKDNKNLNWLGGEEILPYIRRALVEYEIMNLCKKNILKYDYRMAPNKKENCHHLELRTPNSIITISHVSKKNTLPRKSIFRKDLSIFNSQISFFDQDKEFKGPYHLILTHGNKNKMPDFVYIGMPECNTIKWKTNINICKQSLSIVKNTDIVNISDDIVNISDDIVNISDDIEDLGIKKEYLIKRGVLKNDE